jgi:hypothetical protein
MATFPSWLPLSDGEKWVYSEYFRRVSVGSSLARAPKVAELFKRSTLGQQVLANVGVVGNL